MLLLQAAGETRVLWMTPGDLAVAAGTLLLAVMTGVLALVTWKDVRDTHRLAVTAQQAHEARYEPFIWQGEPEIKAHKDGLILRATFPIMNIGAGPAMEISLSVADARDEMGGGIGAMSERWYLSMLLPTSTALVEMAVAAFEVPVDRNTLLGLKGSYYDRSLLASGRRYLQRPDRHPRRID
jgi:hypothetical protein